MLQIELLGPVEARVDGRPVALGGQRPRALFAVLALMGGRVVTSDAADRRAVGRGASRAGARQPADARLAAAQGAGRGGRRRRPAGQPGGRLPAGRASPASATSTAGSRRSAGRVGRARPASCESAREAIEEALGVWRGQPLGGVSANSLLAARARAAGGGAPGRDHRGDRARPRAGPPRRAAGPAGGAGHRASVQGAPGRAADAGALSLRTAGRRAGGLPGRARAVRRRARASSPRSRCASCTRTS